MKPNSVALIGICPNCGESVGKISMNKLTEPDCWKEQVKKQFPMSKNIVEWWSMLSLNNRQKLLNVYPEDSIDGQWYRVLDWFVKFFIENEKKKVI